MSRLGRHPDPAMPSWSPAATIRSKFSVKIGCKAKPAPDLLCRAANVTVNHE